MADQWTIRGREYANCNCDWGCPCQFNAPSTYGSCKGLIAGYIEEGNFNDVKLDDLKWCLMFAWPGEIKDGGGTQQAVIDVRADAAQREALRKILYGESTAEFATHFFVYNAMAEYVLDPVFAEIDLEIDVDGRSSKVSVEGLIESVGAPIIHPMSGGEVSARINLPNGFEYTIAEIGNGNTTLSGEIQLSLENSYGQFNVLHMNQDGVIR